MSSSSSIEGLLGRRGARLHGSGGNQALARKRADVSRLLAHGYEAWDRLRSHLFNPQDHPRLMASEATRVLASKLMARGWIKPASRDGSTWGLDQADEDTERYLRGGWLEEYVWLAHLEAGCDEACFGQQVEWTVDTVIGRNEIDVIARRGEVLSFTSCKCVKPRHASHNERLREFINEVGYWDWHFADREARGLLVTTADLLDEMQHNAARYPTLMARAKVLDVGMAGLEHLGWERLVQSVRAHWL